MKNRWLRRGAVGVGAFLMAVAPGMNMAVQRKLRPDAADLGGYLYQAVGRTVEAFGTDRLTMVFMLAACCWLLRRYLFHKPAKTGLGEYLLCAFFSVMMLLNASIRATETVQTLYENGFQLIKAALYLPGMYLIFLCALRGLNELLRRERNGVPGRLAALWNRHPFRCSFAIIAVAWLPHLLIKYPGVLMMDSYLPMKMFQNTWPRETDHPPFSVLLYGGLGELASLLGSQNAAYFLFTAVQTLCFIAVLAYSLQVMHRLGSPGWVKGLALLLYCLCPVYVGWAVVMVKDSSYLILCMLAGALLMEFIPDPLSFYQSRWRMALLGACLVLLCLTRYNGFFVTVPCLTVMLGMLIAAKAGRKGACRFLCYACVLCLLPMGVNEWIIRSLEMRRLNSQDWMSMMTQQTARVVILHREEITAEEEAALRKILPYDQCETFYVADDSDQIKWNAPPWMSDDPLPEQDWRDFRRVWWQLLLRFPADYLDAMLHMNGVAFDLQADRPVYISLTDNSLDENVYPYSFNVMSMYESEALLPLNSLQRALTEYYFRFSDLPLVGQFAAMGFCVDALLMMTYLCWVNGRRRALLVCLPSLVTAAAGLFCPVVYLRYFLPVVGALPLWLAAYFIDQPRREDE